MKRLSATLAFASAILAHGTTAHGQSIDVSAEHMTTSSLTNKRGETFGSGGLTRYRLRAVQPLSVKCGSHGRPVAWSLALNCAYSDFHNNGAAAEQLPSEALTANISLTHIRPTSPRWDIIASLGCGIYSAPDAIGADKLLVSGACIFAYHLNSSMDIGFGAGLTNSYGIPMIMPMGYFKWSMRGSVELDVNISNSIKIAAAANVSPRFRLSLTAIEFDGIASVVKEDGESKIYSSTLMKSYLTPTWLTSRNSSLYASVGGVWLRSSRMADRKLSSMFDFGNNDGKLRFNASLYLNIGFKQKF